MTHCRPQYAWIYYCCWLLMLYSSMIINIQAKERKQIVVTNQCQPDLQVNQLSNNNNTAFNNTTVVVASQTSYIFTVSPTWSGRIWGQPVCEDDICSHSPVSLAEFTMNTHDHDFYDISFVDGFNLPMTIAPRSIMETNNTNQCQRVGCGQLPKCPNDLIQSQGCQSACSRYHQDEYCCMGDYNTPDTCVTNHIVMMTCMMLSFVQLDSSIRE